MTAQEHKPNPIRAQGRCRVDCSCGWRGPLVSMFGDGHQPWAVHFKEVTDGVPASSVPAELSDIGRTRKPWEFFDGD